MSYGDPVFRQLLAMKNTTKFDLIIIEGFMNECMLPLVAYFDAPFIYMTPIFRLPWLVAATGTPMSFDHFPVVGTAFTDEMSLAERFVNIFFGLAAIYYRQWFVMPTVDERARLMWTDYSMPPISQIENNLSLWITNSDLSINYQFPKTAVVVEAGGLHLTPSQPLPLVGTIRLSDSKTNYSILILHRMSKILSTVRVTLDLLSSVSDRSSKAPVYPKRRVIFSRASSPACPSACFGSTKTNAESPIWRPTFAFSAGYRPTWTFWPTRKCVS